VLNEIAPKISAELKWVLRARNRRIELKLTER